MVPSTVGVKHCALDAGLLLEPASNQVIRNPSEPLDTRGHRVSQGAPRESDDQGTYLCCSDAINKKPATASRFAGQAEGVVRSSSRTTGSSSGYVEDFIDGSSSVAEYGFGLSGNRAVRSSSGQTACIPGGLAPGELQFCRKCRLRLLGYGLVPCLAYCLGPKT